MVRRTGKTFRVILQGLLYASQGEKCIIQTQNDSMAEWTYNKIAYIINAYGLTDCEGNHKIKSIKFPNGGELILVSRLDYQKLEHLRHYKKLEDL